MNGTIKAYLPKLGRRVTANAFALGIEPSQKQTGSVANSEGDGREALREEEAVACLAADDEGGLVMVGGRQGAAILFDLSKAEDELIVAPLPLPPAIARRRDNWREREGCHAALGAIKRRWTAHRQREAGGFRGLCFCGTTPPVFCSVGRWVERAGPVACCPRGLTLTVILFCRSATEWSSCGRQRARSSATSVRRQIFRGHTSNFEVGHEERENERKGMAAASGCLKRVLDAFPDGGGAPVSFPPYSLLVFVQFTYYFLRSWLFLLRTKIGRQ